MKVWDISKTGRKQVMSLTQHTKGYATSEVLLFVTHHRVTCVKWGGEGLLYTSSQDTTIKVWRVSDGALVRTLSVSFSLFLSLALFLRGQGHAHWVNSLSLSTDYAIRTGPFDEHGMKSVLDTTISLK